MSYLLDQMRNIELFRMGIDAPSPLPENAHLLKVLENAKPFAQPKNVEVSCIFCKKYFSGLVGFKTHFGYKHKDGKAKPSA